LFIEKVAHSKKATTELATFDQNYSRP